MSKECGFLVLTVTILRLKKKKSSCLLGTPHPGLDKKGMDNSMRVCDTFCGKYMYL